MSGSSFSSGILTNEGKKLKKEEIENLLDSKIENLSIQVIPLFQNDLVCFARGLGRCAQIFIHPIFTPTFCHIGIHLTLSNDNQKYFNKKKINNVILEYGQYFSDETEKKLIVFQAIVVQILQQIQIILIIIILIKMVQESQ